MVKANELRIGNWVSRKVIKKTTQPDFLEIDEPIHVLAISENGIECRCLDGIRIFDYDQIDPIPLTTEIFYKCGFKPSGYPEWRLPDNFTELVKSGRQLFFYGNSGPIGMPLKFLHQFQNSYFALNGEELKYQP